jgi:hypothetical protein
MHCPAGTKSSLECRRAFDLMGERLVLILQIEAMNLPLDLTADDALGLLGHPRIAILVVPIVLGGVAVELMTPAKAAWAMSVSGTPAINSHTSGVKEAIERVLLVGQPGARLSAINSVSALRCRSLISRPSGAAARPKALTVRSVFRRWRSRAAAGSWLKSFSPKRVPE